MPFLRKIEPKHIFLLLAIFWSAWVWTEITEYIARDTFKHEVDAFMNRGDRFTKERGDELEARVKKIEELEGIEHGSIE